LIAAMLLAGCESSGPSGGVAGKPPPPDFPLQLPPSVERTLPENGRAEIEDAVRRQKRTRLYVTRALLPGLEIVRTHPQAFEEAAKLAGLDERLFEGLIVLECGGREDAVDYLFMRGRGKRAHVGLGQIGWTEGRSAGLKVTPQYETRLKAEIRRCRGLLETRSFGSGGVPESRLNAAIFNSLKRQLAILGAWRKADERFDPKKNLKAAARLLRERMSVYHGDYSLAIASYHAVGGNIGRALKLAKRSHIPMKNPGFWSLYADRSGPVYRLMSDWSDDSRNYLPKALAAADIVEKYLRQPEQFQEEYLYWGPENAAERLAALPYPAFRQIAARSGG
jgi:hypothetical protein